MSNQAIPATTKAVLFTGVRKVQFGDWATDASPLRDDEVAGRTLATLVSPGTEINWAFDKAHDDGPATAGYAAVFEIQAVGAGVKDLTVGQRVFCMGNHMAWQRHRASDVVPVPECLPADRAVFARLMGVSWCTLVTTTARPADRVLVLGLGIIGNLAAQLFQAAGYRVTAVDPSEPRRQIAKRIGLPDVRPSAIGQADIVDQVSLAVDCSGHERAVLDACRVVRKRGEVVLVGVPWKKLSDVTAFDVLHAVFHRYVVLRSGWEWELPGQPREFTIGSLFGNMAAALEWLAAGRVKVDGLYRMANPREAQHVYDDAMAQRGEHLSVVFDWKNA